MNEGREGKPQKKFKRVRQESSNVEHGSENSAHEVTQIHMPENEDLIHQLETKFQDYSERLQKQKEAKPDYKPGEFADTGYKKLLLGELLEKGSVDVKAVHDVLLAAHGKVDEDLFDNAVQVIHNYVSREGVGNYKGDVHVGGMPIDQALEKMLGEEHNSHESVDVYDAGIDFENGRKNLIDLVGGSGHAEKDYIIDELQQLTSMDELKEYLQQNEDVQELVRRDVASQQLATADTIDESTVVGGEEASEVFEVEDDQVISDYINRSIGDSVRIKRSTGTVQDGWTIAGFDEEKNQWIVEKDTGGDSFLKKEVSTKEMDELNPDESIQDDSSEPEDVVPQTIEEDPNQSVLQAAHENAEQMKIDAVALAREIETEDERRERVLKEIKELRAEKKLNGAIFIDRDEIENVPDFNKEAFFMNIAAAKSIEEMATVITRENKPLKEKLMELLAVVSKGITGTAPEVVGELPFANKVEAVQSFDELYDLLDNEGQIQTTRGPIESTDLKELIDRMRAGESIKITRTAGLRDKVRELLRAENG